MIPHPAGVVREVKQSPRLSCEDGRLCVADLQMGCFRRFAALDVRVDYSVEPLLMPGGSSPAVLPSSKPALCCRLEEIHGWLSFFGFQ